MRDNVTLQSKKVEQKKDTKTYETQQNITMPTEK